MYLVLLIADCGARRVMLLASRLIDMRRVQDLRHHLYGFSSISDGNRSAYRNIASLHPVWSWLFHPWVHSRRLP